MTLCMDESKLIVGTSDGLLYVYSNLNGEEKLKVIDIHKNKGFITNIVPISKDLCMFGLDSDCYTSYKNFKVLSKELKNQDTHFTTKFLFPTEKINLHKFTEDLKDSTYLYTKYLGRTPSQIEEDYWNNIMSKYLHLSLTTESCSSLSEKMQPVEPPEVSSEPLNIDQPSKSESIQSELKELKYENKVLKQLVLKISASL